ncbi:hypothetical protein [Streptomyces collinus]
MTDHFPSTPDQASFDEALAQLLGRPSYAAQILHALADLLDDAPDEPLADYVLTQALEWAARSVAHTSPGATSDDLDRATAALPEIGISTHGQYAASLRDIADGLDRTELQAARHDYEANAARHALQDHRDDANLAAYTPRPEQPRTAEDRRRGDAR